MAIIDKPSDYFNTVLYTGNNTDNTSITGVGFQPDWVWLKARNQADYHYSLDAVRGVTKCIFQNDTSAESTFSDSLKSFNTDGFTLGTSGDLNAASQTMVAWNWKAGTSFTNDASATGIGTIDSTGSVNTDAGFSIISYTGTGSAGTVAHGLGAVPKMIIIKSRNTVSLWGVYHQAIGNTHGLFLNATNAATSLSAYWNNTSPTSSVFSLGGDADINKSSDPLIAYCFAEKQGYSKFGSYTGNGNADGTFVYTGFKPALVIIKRTTAGHDWYMNTAKINGYNVQNDFLAPNEPAAEVVDNTAQPIDMLSNGFKCRGTGGGNNESGVPYIYMAFAENPLVASNFVPTTAR